MDSLIISNGVDGVSFGADLCRIDPNKPILPASDSKVTAAAVTTPPVPDVNGNIICANGQAGLYVTEPLSQTYLAEGQLVRPWL